MKVSALKKQLATTDQLIFQQPNGQVIPLHFHLTELGLTSKHFVDCGGTIRTEQHASLQLWVAEDYDHRLSPKKLADIIDKAAPLLQGKDPEVEIEYQMETIGRFGLDFKDGKFVLQPKQTDCLAKSDCGIPEPLALKTVSSECKPGSGCC